MQVSVLYFAVFRDRLGIDSESLELAAGARLADAIATLETRHDVVRGLRGRYRVAINQDMVDGDPALTEGDEIVLIPPVAGGAARHIALVETPLSIDRCVSAVAGPQYGGVAIFCGYVRRESHGAVIDHLEYEAYAPMAAKVMGALVHELEGEIPGCRLAIEHRTGHLAVGELAVVVAAAAAHRAEAFTACRAMIDRLKERVPIWKKEVGEDGAVWVGLGP